MPTRAACGPVQRVVFAAAVAQRLVLDPAAHVVEGVVAQPHDVERVRDLSGFGHRGVERGPVRAREVQHRPADSRAPAAGPPKQPPGRRFGGSASHYVQELAASDVDDAGAPGLGPEPAPAHHQVLVEAQRRHSRDPLGVSVEQRGAPAPDRRVDGVPHTAQLRGDVFERAAPPRPGVSPTAPRETSAAPSAARSRGPPQ